LALFILRAELPQRKVGDVAFFTLIDTGTLLQAFLIQPCQVAVVRILTGIEIDAVAGAVAKAFGFDLLNCFDPWLCT
jgi:hypothetical protein